MSDDTQPKPPASADAKSPTPAPVRQRGGVAPSLLSRLDVAMADHPWTPRVTPFLVYLVLLAGIGLAAEKVPALYAVLYPLQLAIVVALLWRYRKLTPELTLSFHWLAIPTGIIVFIAWVWLGMIIDEAPQVAHVGLAQFTDDLARFVVDPKSVNAQAADGSAFSFADHDSHAESVFVRMGIDDHASLAWFALSLRLLGMSLVVPLFEELFIRSLLLRSFHSAKQTWIGFLQVAQDIPILGDKLMNSRAAREADKQPAMFEHQFKTTPLGDLSFFGVVASTIIFTLSHVPRDYAGCVFCGVAYCLCLRFTAHKGLGPVCWAHGITNALIWVYTIHTSDWRFL